MASAEDLILKDQTIAGVRLANGEEIACGKVVLTTGTFLNGLIHIGETTNSRRPHESRRRRAKRPSHRSVEDALWPGPGMGRLKTGTPPRLDGTTIDWAALEMQPGDDPPQPFSFLTTQDHHAADRLRHHPHHPGDPRRHPRQPAPRADVFGPDRQHRAALLPLHRGQGQPLRRPGSRTRFSLSQKDLATTPSIPTAFPPPCPRMSSWRCWPPFRGWKRPWCCGRAMPSNMTMSIRAN